MLQSKTAFLAVQYPGDDFHRNVSRHTLPGISRRKHLALACRLQFSMELLADGKPAQPFGRRRRQRMNIYGESTPCVKGHLRTLLLRPGSIANELSIRVANLRAAPAFGHSLFSEQINVLYIVYNSVQFEWDADKNRTNQKKHAGIDFETASRIFADPALLLLKDRVIEGEQRWFGIGAVRKAVLIVVHVYREENSNGEEIIRIISAREADSRERRIYLEQTPD
jgi:uncharacterized DUF497 family protein